MPVFPLVLEKHIEITGTLVLKSGLRVGGSKEELDIGGMDNPVIRDPLSKVPYIPGSSIKGKLRTLLEYKYGKGQNDGRPCGCSQQNCPVCTLFGPHMTPTHNLGPYLGPSRLIVRDAFLTPESRDTLTKLREEGLDMVEVKQEVIIDRRTGIAAAGIGPRSLERIPKGDGIKFNLHLSLRIFKGDDPNQLVAWVKEALNLLQKDALGGAGTRGYGWVTIEDLNVSNL